MLLRVASSICLGLEVLCELSRASFFSQRSIRSALNADAPDLAGRTLTTSQRVFVQQLARTIWRLAKLVPFRARCIHRSVAAYRILTRREIPSRLVIAPIDSSDTRFTAHAWVEVAENLTIGAALSSADEFMLCSKAGLVGPI